MPPKQATLSRAVKASVVALLLIALIVSCVSLTAIGTWVEDPSSRGALGVAILIYMFALVGALAVLDWLKQHRWAWITAAALAVLPLAALFERFGAPM